MCTPYASSSSSRLRCGDMRLLSSHAHGSADLGNVLDILTRVVPMSTVCHDVRACLARTPRLRWYQGLRPTWQFVVTRLLARLFKDIRYSLLLVRCLHDSIPHLVSFGGDMRRWFSNAFRHARERMKTAYSDGRRDSANARSSAETLAHTSGK
jgi:hypothetical protein